jgi:dolichol-phosphate mannosyltransferase
MRRFYSWGYNTLVRGLLGTRVRDCDCALKVFQREALAQLLPETAGFFVNTEMLTRARQLGLAVAEVGVRHRPRSAGTSKVSVCDVPRVLRALLPFWWSQVLFPACRVEPETQQRSSPARLGFWTVLLVAALLFFSRLGCPLQEPEEPRYAEIPRQMLERGSLVVPVLNGLPYYDKPPLLYWLVMGCYAVFGVHDWAARLVPSSAGFLTVALTYWWGKRAFGDRAALCSALLLCLSVRFVYLGRLLTMNSLLALWVLAGLATAHQALRGPSLNRGYWIASALACGLGGLTKGPVALCLIGVPVFLFQALEPRAARPGPHGWLVYLGVALGLAVPWYGTLALQDGAFAEYFFWKHNVLRFVVPFDHEEPPWFYLPSLFLGMLPWSLLWLPLGKFLTRRAQAMARQRPQALGFVLLAAAWGLVFYSVAGCKRAGYILPVMPLASLCLGYYLDWVLRQERQSSTAVNWGRLGYLITLLTLTIGTAATAAAWAASILSTVQALFLTAAVVALLAVVLWRGCGDRPEHSWVCCGVVTFGLLLAGVQLVLPAYARRFSVRGQVRPLAELCATARLPVACYPRRWDSIGFYLRRSDVRAFARDQRPELFRVMQDHACTLLFVKSNSALQEVMRELPPDLEFVPRGRQGNLTAGLVRPCPGPRTGAFAQGATPGMSN